VRASFRLQCFLAGFCVTACVASPTSAAPFRVDRGILYDGLQPLPLEELEARDISPEDQAAVESLIRYLDPAADGPAPASIAVIVQLKSRQGVGSPDYYTEDLRLGAARKLLEKCKVLGAAPIDDPRKRRGRGYVVWQFDCPVTGEKRPAVVLTVGVQDHKLISAYLNYDVFIPIYIDLAGGP
jgi:hypothetical protein